MSPDIWPYLTKPYVVFWPKLTWPTLIKRSDLVYTNLNLFKLTRYGLTQPESYV